MPSEVGYKRVTSASPCSFCLMLKNRGAVYSKETVHFQAHDHCSCTSEPDFSRIRRTRKPVPTLDVPDLSVKQQWPDLFSMYKGEGDAPPYLVEMDEQYFKWPGAPHNFEGEQMGDIFGPIGDYRASMDGEAFHVNRMLRAGKQPIYPEIVKALDTALEIIPPTTKDSMVYRWVRNSETFIPKVGGSFVDRGFVSASPTKKEADLFEHYMRTKHGLDPGETIKIIVPKDSQLLWISAFDDEGDEGIRNIGEVVLPRGARFTRLPDDPIDHSTVLRFDGVERSKR